MNKITILYVDLIFKIFQTGINLFYKSNNTKNETKNYQQMLKMKHFVYQLFNFLTKKCQERKYEIFKKIEYKGTHFFIRPLILSDIVMTSPAWEPYVKDIFTLKKEDCVMDIGAHIGTYTIPIAKQITESGKIWAFEPNPRNVEVLKKNIEINKLKNIVVFDMAVSNNNQRTKLTLSDDPMLSMIGESFEEVSVEVECTTLDLICNQINPKKIDWLKIDAEGSEIKVLNGAKKLLEKFHPKIIIEVRKENETELKKILDDFHYKLKYLGGEYFFAISS